MPSQDIILGAHYMTQEVEGAKGEGKLFANDLETTVGRLIFNKVFPEGYRFINETVDKKKISKIISEIYDQFGNEITVNTLDKLKALGFEYAARAGISIAIDDLVVPVTETR